MSKPLTNRCAILLSLGTVISWSQVFAQGAPSVQSFSPSRYSLRNAPTEVITVEFDQAMDASTIVSENFRVYGSWSGFHSGVLSYEAASQTATFETASPFQAGELITVVLTQGITNTSSTPLAENFLWSFFVEATTGTAGFTLDAAYSVGDGPHFVGVGKVNPDADLDLVIPHSKSRDTYSLINQGDGSFSQTDIVSVGTLPRATALGDFDADDDLDAVVANEGSNSLTILDNDGTGTLAAVSTLVLAGAPAYVLSGDLNSDGYLDLVTVNGTSNSISVLLNNGDGSFGAESQFAVGQVPQWAFIADFNNDGFLDVVVSNQGENSISLLTNDGTGALSAAQNFVVGNAPRVIDGHDFNGDGLIDIAVCNINSSTASVLLNNGSSFSAPTDFPVGTEPFALTAGDFDGDRDADFVVVNKGSNDFYVLLNNGSGFFEIDAIYGVGTEPRAINSGDFDGDGVLDLGVANFEADSVQIFFNEFTIPPNRAPESPTLASPVDQTFFGSGQIPFTWNVPEDLDEDSLHFKIEISGSSDFSSVDFTFDSSVDATGFSPVPPVDQNTTSVSFSFNSVVADGRYWWRVSAWDGELSSDPSAPRSFIIDSTSPVLDNVVISEPGFLPNWYNQSTVNSIDFGVQYDESHALRADFDLGELGGLQSISDLASGQDQTVQVPVSLSGVVDGTYTLAVTIVDSIGNQASLDTDIALDGTPPSGTVASSPAVSATENFSVTWVGTGSDGTGSGLSGVYDVQVQIDDGDWIPWRTNFAGTNDVFQGAHGSTYRFEVRAQDNLGNLEPFSDVSETQTVVDTNANDFDAPPAPTNLTAAGSNPSPWQNSSEFELAWELPTDPSGIGRGFYKMGDVPTANFDTTGSLASGTSLTVTATQEDGQNFFLWYEDQRGNVDFNNHAVVLLRYDGTSPDLVEIEIIDPDLTPNWFNPGTTAKARVEINYDEKYMQSIRLDSEDLGAHLEVSPPASGIDIFHLFELVIEDKADGLYTLAITLVDSAGNAAEDSTNIRLDATSPTGTRASSPDTSEALSFMVSWSGTGTDGDGSGLSGVYDVRYQEDGGPWQAWLTNVERTSESFTLGADGKSYGFEAVAHDRLGNVEEFTGNAESTTIVDTGFSDETPPSIIHSPPLMVDQGEAAPIQAQIEDNVGVLQAHLFYRNSGDTDFLSKPMTNVGDGLFEVTFAPEEVPLVGINYYIRAFDGSNFSYHPSINWDIVPNNLAVRIIGSENQGLAINQPLPGGDQSLFFKMISVPLSLENPDPMAVLRDDLGSYDPKQWRLFQYKADMEAYSEYPDVDPFSPGKAFWIIVREPNKVVDSGVGASVATNQPFVITLQQGWNDIAIPYNFPVDWNSLEVIQGSADDIMGPYTYQQEWLLPNQVPTLFPWEGYSVFSNADGVSLQLQPVASLSQTVEKSQSPAEWQIGIEAYSNGVQDRTNFLGVAEDAVELWDARDYLEPPYIGEFVSVRFPHDDWESFEADFTSDFRPPIEDGQVWTFDVKTNTPNSEITLKFRDVTSLPQGLRAILLDKETLQQIDLQASPEYLFELQGTSLSRRFDLVIGTEDFIRNSEELNQPTPDSFFLTQNFPNPFNAGTSMTYHVPEASHVRIQILNILGQEVRELLSERRTPGTYRVQWDGKSNNGKEISSGIYLVRFEAGQFHQIRKITLLR